MAEIVSESQWPGAPQTVARRQSGHPRWSLTSGPRAEYGPAPVRERSTAASMHSIGALARQAGPVARQASSLARFALARATGRKFPLMVTLSLTDKCNFRCHYCDLPHMNRQEMTTADWHRAIDELADAGMMRVSIMGGEPLLRKDVGELIDHLKARGVNLAGVSLGRVGFCAKAIDSGRDVMAAAAMQISIGRIRKLEFMGCSNRAGNCRTRKSYIVTIA